MIRGSRRAIGRHLRWHSNTASASHLNKHSEDAAVLFLTGANGFLGGAIAETIDKEYSGRIVKVYCPLRAKDGVAGSVRFRSSELQHLPTAAMVSDSSSSTLPLDATHLILNAYDTRFFHPTVDGKLRDNVKPMLHLLDQCANNNAAQRKTSIEGITVVSTAYVQQPLPFPHPENSCIPWVLEGTISACDLYNAMVEQGENLLTWRRFLKTYGILLPDYYKQNAYIFSKLIMEHVIMERYSHLPITIVRPSIVAPSLSSMRGWTRETMTGLSCLIHMSHTAMRVPRTEGYLSCVDVEDVARDCIETLLESGERPRIRMSTGPSQLEVESLFNSIAPDLWRFYGKHLSFSHLVRKFLRMAEEAATSSPKEAKLVAALYKNYDPFAKQTWDFPETHCFDKDEFLRKACDVKGVPYFQSHDLPTAASSVEKSP